MIFNSDSYWLQSKKVQPIKEMVTKAVNTVDTDDSQSTSAESAASGFTADGKVNVILSHLSLHHPSL